MTRYEKIIFVCTGNTCRSPMAEAIYHSLDSHSDIITMSRGLVVLFPEPPNPKAELVLTNHDLSLENHMAKQLTNEDMDDNTLVLSMTVGQKKKILDHFEYNENVYTVKEFVGEVGDVSDPYGGSLIDYEDCYVELSRIVKKTVLKLNEEAL